MRSNLCYNLGMRDLCHLHGPSSNTWAFGLVELLAATLMDLNCLKTRASFRVVFLCSAMGAFRTSIVSVTLL